MQQARDFQSAKKMKKKKKEKTNLLMFIILKTVWVWFEWNLQRNINENKWIKTTTATSHEMKKIMRANASEERKACTNKHCLMHFLIFVFGKKTPYLYVSNENVFSSIWIHQHGTSWEPIYIARSLVRAYVFSGARARSTPYLAP